MAKDKSDFLGLFRDLATRVGYGVRVLILHLYDQSFRRRLRKALSRFATPIQSMAPSRVPGIWSRSFQFSFSRLIILLLVRDNMFSFLSFQRKHLSPNPSFSHLKLLISVKYQCLGVNSRTIFYISANIQAPPSRETQQRELSSQNALYENYLPA